MSSLVGDVIMQARDLMQDPPQSMNPPTFSAIAGVTAFGGTLPLGTYYVIVTALNQWGETSGSIELSITTSGAQNAFQLTITALPPGATSYRAYIGSASGGENYWVTPIINAGILAVINIATQNPGYPPATSSAYLPDTDGGYARAAVMFRWLNDGLRQASRLAGGLPDYSGFPSTINYGTYLITGEWAKMTQAWYDGYPVAFATSGSFFKRNNVTSSILAGWSVAFYNNQMGVEVWPQPARTATQTTLSGGMGITDTAATLTSTAGFLLPVYGMVQFGGPGGEICAYNGINGGQLIGLIRGLGGTVPTAWPVGAQVNELNAFFQGRRIFNTQYIPGQSILNLPVPAGFDGILINYLMAQYFTTERDAQSASSQMKMFTDSIKEYMRMNRQIAGPRQAGDRDYQFVVFGGTRFGGNVIQ